MYTQKPGFNENQMYARKPGNETQMYTRKPGFNETPNVYSKTWFQ